MKVSLIVPGYKCDEYIFRNIDSILDQDYKDYEIIVVLNGVWDTKEQLKHQLYDKYGDKITVISLAEGHLGLANNVGFRSSTGNIISHLSSDLYLMPGTLRTWVDAFKEHPEVGMVYSGYRFVDPDPSSVYYADRFDRYHLECENFIDGANPVRRANWKEWSINLKSLIDWDWVLSITDDGTLAHYIQEPLYYAEHPKEGGLSHDSNSYWIQRRREVQARHNIPNRNICVCSLEDQSYALELAKLLDCDYRIHPGHKPHSYDLIYAYGFNCRTDDKELMASTSLFFQHWKHKVVHWRTEDIRLLMQERWLDVRRISNEIIPHIRNNFCTTVRDQETLLHMGINAEIRFLPSSNERPEFKEGVSVNDESIMDQLKKAMPDIKFHKNDLGCPITVHYEDRVDRVIKSLAMGNIVISNAYIKGVERIEGYTNVPELRKMLVHAIRRMIKSPPESDMELIESYRSKIKPRKYRDMLDKIAMSTVNKYGKILMNEANA